MKYYEENRKKREGDFRGIYSIMGVDAMGFKHFQYEKEFANPESARQDGWNFAKKVGLGPIENIHVIMNYPIFEVTFNFIEGARNSFYVMELRSKEVVESIVRRAFPGIKYDSINVKLITVHEMDADKELFAFETLLNKVGVKLS